MAYVEEVIGCLVFRGGELAVESVEKELLEALEVAGEGCKFVGKGVVEEIRGWFCAEGLQKRVCKYSGDCCLSHSPIEKDDV